MRTPCRSIGLFPRSFEHRYGTTWAVRPAWGRIGPVPGAIAILVVLVVLPVVVCMSFAVVAAVLGGMLNKDAEVRGEGSELLDLNV